MSQAFGDKKSIPGREFRSNPLLIAYDKDLRKDLDEAFDEVEGSIGQIVLANAGVPAPISYTTTDGAEYVMHQFNITDNSAERIEFNVVARRTGTNLRAAWSRVVFVTRHDGTSSMPTVLVVYPDEVVGTLTWTLDTVLENNAVKIKVRGAVGSTIHWTTTFRRTATF